MRRNKTEFCDIYICARTALRQQAALRSYAALDTLLFIGHLDVYLHWLLFAFCYIDIWQSSGREIVARDEAKNNADADKPTSSTDTRAQTTPGSLSSKSRNGAWGLTDTFLKQTDDEYK